MRSQTTSLRTPRFLAVLIGLLMLGVAAAGAESPVAGAPAAPPSDTFEIMVSNGSTVVAPGGSLTFVGTCWSAGLGPAQVARVRGYRIAGSGNTQPFEFWVTATMNTSTGGFVGSISVPGDAPNAAYALEVSCWVQDQLLGSSETPFTVDGPMITTTTSSTTTTTSSTLRAEPYVGEPPVAAEPLHADPAFTG